MIYTNCNVNVSCMIYKLNINTYIFSYLIQIILRNIITISSDGGIYKLFLFMSVLATRDKRLPISTVLYWAISVNARITGYYGLVYQFEGLLVVGALLRLLKLLLLERPMYAFNCLRIILVEYRLMVIKFFLYLSYLMNKDRENDTTCIKNRHNVVVDNMVGKQMNEDCTR